MKTIEETILSRDLILTCRYIPRPYNTSHDAPWEKKSLKFKMELYRKGRVVPPNGILILAFNYHFGMGHLKGKPLRYFGDFDANPTIYNYDRFQNLLDNVKLIENNLDFTIRDILRSLAMDADVLNYVDFPDWAENYDYSPDSIKAKGIYDATLSQTLKLKQLFTEDEIHRLADEEDTLQNISGIPAY